MHSHVVASAPRTPVLLPVPHALPCCALQCLSAFTHAHPTNLGFTAEAPTHHLATSAQVEEVEVPEDEQQSAAAMKRGTTVKVGGISNSPFIHEIQNN